MVWVRPRPLPRHQVTETPAVAHALEVAARRWPGEPRSKLLLRLLLAGGEAIERADEDEIARRHTALDATEGSYDGVYGQGYLATLRRDWPK
jgi:hypothetical protein